jgi:OmpA-OmpF porin, OOP family
VDLSRALGSELKCQNNSLMAASSCKVLGSTLATCAAAVCLLAPARAAAQQSLDQAFADGFSLQRFEPSPAGDRFFVVPEGAVPQGRPGIYAQVLGHYTLRPSLVRTDNVTGQDRELVSKQFFVHPAVSWAPTTWLLAHFDLPIAASQSGQGPNAPESPAVGDGRLGARVGLVGDEHSAFALAPGVDVWLPFGSQRNLVGDGAFRVLPRLNISGEILPFAYAASVGYQLRKKVDTGSLQVGDSLFFSAALGLVLFDEVLSVGPEFHAQWLVEADSQAFASRTSHMEMLFGARARISDVVLGAGVGPSLSDAPGVAPRAVFSLAYAPRTKAPRGAAPPPPTDRDNDGVWDSDDACPEQAGPSRPDPGQSGCPDGRSAPSAAEQPAAPAEKSLAPTSPDADGDGIPDGSDACPKEPGATSNDPEAHGCPLEVDADGDGVPDDKDACPKEPGIKSSDPKTSGCAAKVDAGKVKDSAEVTFSGYQTLPGNRGIVFVELTDPVAVEVTRNGQVIEYKLVGASVPLKNNKNPLLLRDFGAAATSAVLIPDKKAVRLVITLRGSGKVSPSHRMVARGHGAALEIELPAPPGR